MNRQPGSRRLSVGTLFFKKVFPIFFLGSAALTVLTAFWRAASDGVESALEYMPLAGVMVVIYVFFRLVSKELVDEVFDGGDSLIVRNNGIEERVLLSEIAQVRESIWRQGPPRVELLLRTPGALGRVIAFMPTSYSLFPLSRSPVFHELTARVERAHQETEKVKSRPTPT